MMSLKVPARPESLSAIGNFALAAADAAGLDARARFRLRLAVDEFATNIVSYGYGDSAAAGEISLQAVIDEQALTLTIEDNGVPFDPRQVPPPADLHLPLEQRKPGGLGIYLALRRVDKYSYERVGDRNRSVLVVNRSPGKDKG